MSKAVFYCSFSLNEGTPISEFLEAAKKLNDGFISKQKGYISWKQLNDGNTWVDFVTFETMDDVKNFEANSINAGELAEQFFSFIDLSSCKVSYFTIEKEY